MQIPQSDWKRFTDALGKINTTAASKMQNWITLYGIENSDALIEYAYGLVTKYGEASAALSCAMYDAIAMLQKANVSPAIPAETASIDYTAKAVMGTIKNENNTVPETVGRLVKQAGADTMLQNARRDRAEWAWIPSGDTCAFCITLASRGWQKMSKRALRDGHAEHIHANCNCQYAVRFDSSSGVAGYDPDKYLETYEDAEGYTSKEKINSIRREQYAEQKEENKTT